jgi:ribokinase
LRRKPKLTVVGSANVDLVARCKRLPEAGETIGEAIFSRVAGGKGANQAAAAARLGADVRFVGRVGRDDLTLRALEDEGVDVTGVVRDEGESGVALIVVDEDGENTIVVAPEANGRLQPDDVEVGEADAVLCQLEVKMSVVQRAAAQTTGMFCLNVSPAQSVPKSLLRRVDLVVANDREVGALGATALRKLLAMTMGADGAVLWENGSQIAEAKPPLVKAVDGTAAGDAFCACLIVSLLEERTPQDALTRACAAGAIAASRFGAQPSLPTADEVDAILRA